MTLSLVQPAAPICDKQMQRIWEAAWLTHKLAELPDVRAARVAQIRADLDAGSYLSDAEYAALLDDVIDDIAADLA